MNREEEVKAQLLQQIAETHDRYCEVMEERLAAEGLEAVELYFGVVSKLVAKLEGREKPLRAVAQEMVVESAALLMGQLGGR